ncbi:hypothetical protein [Halobacterium salinarum]|uniref:Coiled-coil protein n=1 Tax=Halobacterium salinarum (strain ATCC 29341 / DSM 671 / R1) TaxID=478009 RepID=B0R999_HALS3|nr:hypothetical protein [Halobacterium salinarum]CAP15404.1 coiled-coil protein [Halobacterium salinarum R1]
MKDDARFTLQLGGIVLLTAAVGLGVFLYVGSQAGVYALGVGIPLVVVGAAVVYARRERPSKAPQTSRFFEDKAESVAEQMRSLLGEYDRLDERFSDWDTSDFDDELGYALDQFADAGVEFDRGTNRFDVVGGGEVRDLERLEERVDELQSELGSSAARHVDREREVCRDAQQSLVNADLVDNVREPPTVDGENPNELLATIEEFDECVRDSLEEAVENLHAVADPNDQSGDVVERGVGTARSALDRGDYAGVADALLDTRKNLERDLSADFEAEHDALDSLLDTVTSSVVTDYVSRSLVADVEDVQHELDSIDTALELSELEGLTERATDSCTAMVDEMVAELDDRMETLAASSVPDDFYEYQAASDEAYVSRLRTADDLDEYRSEWLTAVGELAGALDAVEEEAAVATAYGEISDEIAATLRETGRVEPSDLKVKQPNAFMELYASETDGVTYEPSTPAVVADDFGETYDVDIQAGFAEGGPERTVSISLVGPSFDVSEMLETHLLDVVTFEDVPYGEYTLTVSTDEEGYVEVEREIVVDDDMEIESLLEEMALRDAVCEGVESDARDALADAASLFADRYEEAEYLSETMDLPMNDKYVPCMLTLWADDEGLTARRVDGDVLVYDGEQFASRLSNIVEHNLAEGESMSYDDIRSRYLSVPASRELIVETLRGSSVGGEVDFGKQELSK